MKRTTRILASALVNVALLNGAALAQDAIPAPAFGSSVITVGSTIDVPNSVNLIAGGSNFFDDGNGCSGFIAEAPDYHVDLIGDDNATLPLLFAAESTGDTILVILDPEGNVLCSDDAVELDPAVVIDWPLTGPYDIWVGTYHADEYPEATLYTFELLPEDGAVQMEGK